MTKRIGWKSTYEKDRLYAGLLLFASVERLKVDDAKEAEQLIVGGAAFFLAPQMAGIGIIPVIDAIYAATGKGFNQQDKKLFGNRFAQFIKATSEIRYNYNLGEKQHLVGRLMAGVAYSYGNATTTPYSEQFYIGGANSIRDFTIRSIGPGSFRPTDSQYG